LINNGSAQNQVRRPRNSSPNCCQRAICGAKKLSRQRICLKLHKINFYAVKDHLYHHYRPQANDLVKKKWTLLLSGFSLKATILQILLG
jgi:hypothetical protein